MRIFSICLADFYINFLDEKNIYIIYHYKFLSDAPQTTWSNYGNILFTCILNKTFKQSMNLFVTHANLTQSVAGVIF